MAEKSYGTSPENATLTEEKIAEKMAYRVSGRGKNLNVAIFSDTVNVKNVKLCIMVLLTELYPFIPLSVILIRFQGHSSVKQFNRICYVLIRLKSSFAGILRTSSRS